MALRTRQLEKATPSYGYIVVAVVCTVIGLGVVVMMMLQLEDIEKRNNSKSRALLCIASENPNGRTIEYVKKCYDDADKANDTHIDRYGDALK